MRTLLPTIEWTTTEEAPMTLSVHYSECMKHFAFLIGQGEPVHEEFLHFAALYEFANYYCDRIVASLHSDTLVDPVEAVSATCVLSVAPASEMEEAFCEL